MSMKSAPDVSIAPVENVPLVEDAAFTLAIRVHAIYEHVRRVIQIVMVPICPTGTGRWSAQAAGS